MDILVYADWKGLETPTLMGVLSVKHTRGHAVFTFSYDKLWLKTGNAQSLDPNLQLYDGPQFLACGLFAYLREEESPKWIAHLTPTALLSNHG